MTEEIPEVRVAVSREKLASLCAKARDAALDLQAMAWAEITLKNVKGKRLTYQQPTSSD